MRSKSAAQAKGWWAFSRAYDCLIDFFRSVTSFGARPAEIENGKTRMILREGSRC